LPAVQFAGRQPETDLSPAAWLAAGTAGAPWPTVAALLPRGFAAYARVFHPASRYEGDDDVEVSWRAVADDNGTSAHPLMQWPGVTGGWEYCTEESQPPLWDRAPDEGHLPAEVAARLAAVLSRHTATPGDCWFGVGVDGVVLADAPVLALPQRGHWLVRGPVELAAANLAAEPAEQSASLWWPADRGWWGATDADRRSTYVGGSAACTEDLLAASGIEAAPAAPEDAVGFAADMINPVPPRG
jgi:hypothetical protein